jgi:exonuclease SbcC
LTSTIEKAIMQKVHHEFDELFRKWFDIMMDTNDLDVRLDEEFTPVIMQNNYETEITNLSGGERTSVALAYRLALNKVINDFISTIKTKDILILDEPTDGFSTEQLDKMRDVFDELRMGQMIIVSHEAKMESYVQNIIRIVKNEHNSKVMT